MLCTVRSRKFFRTTRADYGKPDEREVADE
jgi:hypothetical protein